MKSKLYCLRHACRAVGGFGVCAALALAAFGANAESADRLKPVTIEANKGELNDLTQISTYTGKAILTKGSLILRCDVLTVRQDPEGFQSGTCVGKPASFRQKRDAPNQFIEGAAARIDYDGKLDTVKFTERAVVKRLEGVKVADEVTGSQIVYNGRSELYTVEGRENERIRIVIQSKSDPAAAATPSTRPPAELKPALQLAPSPSLPK
jgi:lipopolysaccharide export system protein LptA